MVLSKVSRDLKNGLSPYPILWNHWTVNDNCNFNNLEIYPVKLLIQHTEFRTRPNCCRSALLLIIEKNKKVLITGLHVWLVTFQILSNSLLH